MTSQVKPSYYHDIDDVFKGKMSTLGHGSVLKSMFLCHVITHARHILNDDSIKPQLNKWSHPVIYKDVITPTCPTFDAKQIPVYQFFIHQQQIGEASYVLSYDITAAKTIVSKVVINKSKFFVAKFKNTERLRNSLAALDVLIGSEKFIIFIGSRLH